MVWRILLLVPFALGAAIPAQAGIFNRSSKQPARPAAAPDHVGELIRALKVEPDERRRATIASELSRFDLKQAPQAGGALIESLQNDPSPLVRNEAAESLGKMKPLTYQVAQALDQAFNTDPASRVRLTARNSLLPFLQAGYKPTNRSEVATAEPPRVAPTMPARPISPPPVAPAPLPSSLVKRNVKPPTVRETNEPPLAGSSPVEVAKPLSPAPSPSAVPVPTIMRVNPPLPIDEPKTTGPVIKPETTKETKPAATTPSKPVAPAQPAPAKPEVEGPILIPPE
jgi:hypothetical protein